MKISARRYLADFLTFLNLMCGCLSLGCLLGGLLGQAAMLILVAVLFDGCDGYIARKFGSAGDFGKNLDSFADLVSFGVAPAGLVFLLLAPATSGAFPERAVSGGVAAAVLLGYILCAALRLARYNVSSGSERSFAGLPTTMSGASVASVVLLHLQKGWIPDERVFLFCMACLAALMISHVSYPNMRGIRQILLNRRLLITLAWCALLSFTAWTGRQGGAGGLFLSGFFLVYIVFFPWLKRNFV